MSAAPRRTISVVVPALNEERDVRAAVAEAIAAVSPLFHDYEIICVDDGSTDRTGAIMDELAASDPHVRVIHNARPHNFGGAFKKGLAAARHDYVLCVPGDNENPREAVVPLLERVGEADMVLSYPERKVRSAHRNAISGVYTGVVNALFGLRVRYFNGTVVHRRDLLRQISIETDSFAYQTEAIVKLLARGATFVEVGITSRPHAAAHRTSAFRLENLVGVGLTLARLRLSTRRR
jgi:glycosyltransferase involved in cell wall biosynthesis